MPDTTGVALDESGARGSVEQNDWIDVLESKAHDLKDKRAFVFLEDEGRVADVRTFGQLAENAKAIAATFDAPSFRGTPVVLFISQGIQFVDAFFGVIYAGGIPVPAFAPHAHRDNSARMEAIVRDCGAKHIVVDRAGFALVDEWKGSSDILSEAELIDLDAIPAQRQEPWVCPGIERSDVAFLQYTSGSTGTPKGVMVTNHNLLENMALLKGFYAQDSDSIFVSWVPLYHDLGLIGNTLFPISLGATCVMMSPETFIKNPRNWLNAISTYQATISFAPTFAYEFSTRCLPELEEDALDLTSWRVAVIGAEPIYKEAMDRFSSAFAKFGFQGDRFQAAYGLAESTLMVVTTPRSSAPNVIKVDLRKLEQGIAQETNREEPNEYRWAVCSGVKNDSHEIAVIEPGTGKPCADGQVGEVWLSGPCIAKGYFRNPEKTTETFKNRVQGRQPASFLRTGDLGFMKGDELYITGRSKDLIIVNGANYYPQDIEYSTWSADGRLRRGCAAAFGVQDNAGEKVIVTVEVRDPEVAKAEAESIFTNVTKSVEYRDSIPLHDVVLLEKGGVAKTSSGKIQRQLMKKRYESGRLKMVANMRHQERQQKPSGNTALRNWIHFTIASLAEVPIAEIDLSKHITRLGLDSLKIVRFITAVSEYCQIPEDKLTPWSHSSTDEWVAHLDEYMGQ